jgi:hypothetical protein
MKFNKSSIFAFVLLIVAGSVLRVMGFSPQIALAVFGAAVFTDKKLAFALPLFSMLLSDLFFEALFRYGYANYGGFYEGQVSNYLLIVGVSFIGIWARNLRWERIVAASVSAPVLFFLASNFMVWAGGGGLQRPKTFDGLLLCYGDALPFFKTSFEYTLLFSAILFGGYFLSQRVFFAKKQLA